MKYNIKTSEHIKAYSKQILFLLITATPTETLALQAAMHPLESEDKLIAVRSGALTYYLGYFGQHAVCQVESGMGSVGVGASTLTTQQAVVEWHPKAIVMIGIAFGVDSTKQRIGDVLLANPIVPYENKRVGTNEIIPRGQTQSPNPILTNYFRHSLGWQHSLRDGEIARLKIGPVLSGEVLVDNVTYRNELVGQYPEAIGGEMEGAGLVAVAFTHGVPWALIKGICDFADGEKGKNKDQNQQDAIAAALSLCLHVFKQEGSFRELINISPSINSDQPSLPIKNELPPITNDLLANATFSVYSPSVEKYYISRTLDQEFEGFLRMQKSIWLYGDSGTGKTSLVYRNVFRKVGRPYIVDLSGCDSLADTTVLNYINQQLLDIKGLDNLQEAENLPTALDQLLTTLRTHYRQGDCIVFEEVPVSEQNSAPVKAIILLLVRYYNMSLNSYCQFTFTSIGSPRPFLNASTTKATEKIKFQQLYYWQDNDLVRLCTIIEESSDLHLDFEQSLLLRNKSQGSPRFIKGFYNNMHALKGCGTYEFSRCLEQTYTDLYGYD